MTTITVNERTKSGKSFLSLAKKIAKIDANIKVEKSFKKEKILKNIKQGFKEMSLIKKAKMKTTSLSDFLNEI